MNSLDCYSYRLIGKLTAFLRLQEFNLSHPTVDYSTFVAPCALHSLKGKVGSTLTKAATLRVNLNIDGMPIASRTHTHPSHSQTSRLLTSSLSLGVPVPRATLCMGDVSLSQISLLVFYHTDTFICFLFRSRFIPS